MKGLQFLIQRKKIKEFDFKEYELKYNISVPPKYCNFISIFHLDRFNMNYFFNSENGGKYPLGGPIFGGCLDEKGHDKYSFEEFIPPENIFYLYDEDYKNNDYNICSKKLIPIGISGIYNTGGGFLLGTTGDLQDKILLDLDTNKQQGRFIEIANDIFDFASKFILNEINMDYVHKNLDRNQLYKNWGEKFWRIKNEK